MRVQFAGTSDEWKAYNRLMMAHEQVEQLLREQPEPSCTTEVAGVYYTLVSFAGRPQPELAFSYDNPVNKTAAEIDMHDGGHLEGLSVVEIDEIADKVNAWLQMPQFQLRHNPVPVNKIELERDERGDGTLNLKGYVDRNEYLSLSVNKHARRPVLINCSRALPVDFDEAYAAVVCMKQVMDAAKSRLDN